MDKNNIISIIIPCYNYGDYLADAINSALAQERDGLSVDIIVVDDGSSDNSAEVVKTFGDSIKYVYQNNQGLSAARNTGIKNAEGDFYVFLDADDILCVGVLRSHLDNFHKNPDLDISVCRCLSLYEDRASAYLWPLVKSCLDLYLCYSNVAPVHTFMVRKGVIEEAGFFNSDLLACEDYDYWARCAILGKRFGSNAEGCVIYRHHGDSITTYRERQHAYDVLVRDSIARALKSVPEFPLGRKYYGWLSYAAGSINGSIGLSEYFPDLAGKAIRESGEAVMEAARSGGGMDSGDAVLVNMEKYYVANYMKIVNGQKLNSLPALKRASEFLIHKYPNIAQLSGETLQKKSAAYLKRFLCDDQPIRSRLAELTNRKWWEA